MLFNFGCFILNSHCKFNGENGIKCRKSSGTFFAHLWALKFHSSPPSVKKKCPLFSHTMWRETASHCGILKVVPLKAPLCRHIWKGTKAGKRTFPTNHRHA